MSGDIELVSPCVGVCALDADTGLCRGCLRTSEEIAVWPSLPYAGRIEVIERLHARRRQAGLAGRRTTRRRRRASALRSGAG